MREDHTAILSPNLVSDASSIPQIRADEAYLRLTVSPLLAKIRLLRATPPSKI